MKILSLSFFVLLFAGVYCQNLTVSENQDWEYFMKNSECSIKSNTDKIESGQYPVFFVEIKYTGDKTFLINWDSNFAKVLWDGSFVLESQFNSIVKFTDKIKFQTSNTYEPEMNLLLKKGDILTSTLDLSILPGSFIKNIFPVSGSVEIFLNIHESETGKMIRIGNSLHFKIFPDK